MSDDKFSEYTQHLYDTVLSLRVEVDNLRTAYGIVHRQIDELTSISDTNTADALKDAISVERLAKLSLIAAQVAEKAATILGDKVVIEKTQATVLSAEDTHKSAVASSKSSQARKTSAGFPMGGGSKGV